MQKEREKTRGRYDYVKHPLAAFMYQYVSFLRLYDRVYRDGGACCHDADGLSRSALDSFFENGVDGDGGPCCDLHCFQFQNVR